MDKEVITIDQLPLEEKVYLKKDFLGYRIVHPIRDKDGKLNLINFLVGGKRNLFSLLLVLLLFGLFSYGVYELTHSMRDVVENPCDYCTRSIITNLDTGLQDIGGFNEVYG